MSDQEIKVVTEYCPLSREALVENARLRHLVGEGDNFEDESMLLKEVKRLHAERDWALQQLADALDRPLSDARIMMRRAFGNMQAEAEKLTDEDGHFVPEGVEVNG